MVFAWRVYDNLSAVLYFLVVHCSCITFYSVNALISFEQNNLSTGVVILSQSLNDERNETGKSHNHLCVTIAATIHINDTLVTLLYVFDWN